MKISSIIHLLVFIFISVLSVMLLSILAISWLNAQFNANMDKLVSDSGKFISLSVKLKDTEDRFERFDRTADDTAADYEDAIHAADEAMEILRPSVNVDQYVAMFYRSLTIMRGYEAELRTSLYQTDPSTPGYFNLRNRLTRAYGFIIQQSHNMQNQYQQYMNRRYAELTLEYNTLRTRTYVAVLCVSCVIFFFIAAKLRKVIIEIRRYTTCARDLEAGQFDMPDLRPCGLAELDAFATAFNSMKSTIRQNIIDLRGKADMESQLKLLKQSQFRLLQHNMNPHFLFNTLNIISRLAMFEGSRRIVDLMESVAKILRYSISNLERLVPLSEELSIASAYIDIQKLRFGEWITFDIHVDGSGALDAYRTPPMILQPIIENSIKHGFKNKSKDCEICLHVTQSGGCAVITAEDNGGGMSEEEILSVFEKEDSTGLRNIKERLYLIFTQEGLIKLEGKQTGGLLVTIRLPLPDDPVS